MKAKQDFKVGDKVYTIKNSSWGLKPMEIVKNQDFSVICKHPDFTGTGFFRKNEIELFSVKRQSALNELISLYEKIDMEKDRLFS